MLKSTRAAQKERQSMVKVEMFKRLNRARQ